MVPKLKQNMHKCPRCGERMLRLYTRSAEQGYTSINAYYCPNEDKIFVEGDPKEVKHGKH